MYRVCCRTAYLSNNAPLCQVLFQEHFRHELQHLQRGVDVFCRRLCVGLLRALEHRLAPERSRRSQRVCFIQPSTLSLSRLFRFIFVSFKHRKIGRARLRCWFSVCGLSVLLTSACIRLCRELFKMVTLTPGVRDKQTTPEASARSIHMLTLSPMPSLIGAPCSVNRGSRLTDGIACCRRDIVTC